MADISDQISFTGEVNLIEAKIISSTGVTTDISALLADLTIFEDLFSNTMSGYAIIQDALDLIENIPLIGQELLSIEIRTPTITNSIKKIFYIYKLQHRIVNSRSQVYMINFCSQELIKSSNSKISKAYSGKISDSVASIFTDTRYLDSKETLFIEPTKNSYSFIAPFWSPLETINWLTGKSLNAQGVANYLFYETNQSFEFVSADMLIKQVPVREYIFSDVDGNTAFGANGSKDGKTSIVESMENPVTFDYLKNLSAGMYASKLYTYDLTTKNINNVTYDYIDDFGKASHLEKDPLKTNALFRKKLSNLYFIHKNNYQTGTFKQQGYKDFFLQRNSLLEQLSAFKICIKVSGRTDVKVGQVITFTINQLRQILGDEIETTGKSSYFSGKYLITAIRHQIISGKHTMNMEIISDSFIKNLIVK